LVTRKDVPSEKIFYSNGDGGQVKAFHGERKKYRDETATARKGLVIDRFNPEKSKVIEMPIIDDVNDLNLSEASSEVISSPTDTTKIKELKGEEALKALREGKKEYEEKDRHEDENKYENINV
jgi:hypothetical protein